MSAEKVASLQKCRDIKDTIINYGVSEQEIKHLIKILSLELEDRDFMLKVIDIFKDENNQNIEI